MKDVNPWIVISILTAAVTAVILLRVADFIEDFWVGMGLIALLSFLAFLRMIPVPKMQVFVGVVYVIAVLFYILIPKVKKDYLASRLYTSEALADRHVYNDLQLSERIRPIGLLGKEAWKKYCDDIEYLQSLWVNGELGKLKEELKTEIKVAERVLEDTGELPEPNLDRQEELAQYQLRIKEIRARCSDLIKGKEPEATKMANSGWKFQLPSLPSSLSAVPVFFQENWFWIAVAILGVLLLVALIRRFKGGRLTFGRVVVILLLIALGWSLYQHWGQIKGELLKAQTQTAAASAVPPLGAINSFTFNAGETEETLEGGDGIWYRIWADKYFTIIQKRGNVIKEIPKPADKKFYWGGPPGGIIKLLGIENNTTVWMQRIQVRWK